MIIYKNQGIYSNLDKSKQIEKYFTALLENSFQVTKNEGYKEFGIRITIETFISSIVENEKIIINKEE